MPSSDGTTLRQMTTTSSSADSARKTAADLSDDEPISALRIPKHGSAVAVHVDGGSKVPSAYKLWLREQKKKAKKARDGTGMILGPTEYRHKWKRTHERTKQKYNEQSRMAAQSKHGTTLPDPTPTSCVGSSSTRRGVAVNDTVVGTPALPIAAGAVVGQPNAAVRYKWLDDDDAPIMLRSPTKPAHTKNEFALQASPASVQQHITTSHGLGHVQPVANEQAHSSTVSKPSTLEAMLAAKFGPDSGKLEGQFVVRGPSRDETEERLEKMKQAARNRIEKAQTQS